MTNPRNNENELTSNVGAGDVSNVSALAVPGILVPSDQTISEEFREPSEQTPQLQVPENPDRASKLETGVAKEVESRTSTGPRTPQGKERAKHNAIRHGIFADIVLTGAPFRESLEDYIRLLEKLRDDIRPVGALQEVLVEQLAFELLRLGRVYNADAQVAPMVFKQLQKDLKKDNPSILGLVDQKDEALVIRRELASELLLRYGNSVSKQIHRILDRLERLQHMRKDQ